MTPIWGYSGNTASLLTNTMRFPLLTQSGHTELHCTCPLSGVKRTSLPSLWTSQITTGWVAAVLGDSQADFCKPCLLLAQSGHANLANGRPILARTSGLDVWTCTPKREPRRSGATQREFICGPLDCLPTLCLYRKQSHSRPSRLHSGCLSLRAQAQRYARTRPCHRFAVE
jgi:hypothetical protein